MQDHAVRLAAVNRRPAIDNDRHGKRDVIPLGRHNGSPEAARASKRSHWRGIRRKNRREYREWVEGR